MTTYSILSYRTGRTVRSNITAQQAMSFLKLAEKTFYEKAIYGELVRGAWKIIPNGEIEPLTEKGTFTPAEREDFINRWHKMQELFGVEKTWT